MTTHDPSALFDRLVAWFASEGGAAIAFSGGVDSALLLAAAHRALGDRAVGFVAVSPALGDEERDGARALSAAIGARIVEVETAEIDDERYRRNDSDRCYFCRTHMYGAIREAAAAAGVGPLIDGTHADDVGDYRPGRRAAAEYGVRSPLLELGFTKADVRAVARHTGLSVWDKPAMPCLASRIPYHRPVTPAKLAQIEAAEAVLRRNGFRECRVRHFDAEARVEVPAADVASLQRPARWAAIERAIRAVGFERVAVEPDGLRSGRLNESLRVADPRGPGDGRRAEKKKEQKKKVD